MKKITLVVLSLFVVSPLFALTPQEQQLKLQSIKQQNLKNMGGTDYRDPAYRVPAQKR